MTIADHKRKPGALFDGSAGFAGSIGHSGGRRIKSAVVKRRMGTKTQRDKSCHRDCDGDGATGYAKLPYVHHKSFLPAFRRAKWVAPTSFMV
jgi:hypothetical protein